MDAAVVVCRSSYPVNSPRFASTIGNSPHKSSIANPHL